MSGAEGPMQDHPCVGPFTEGSQPCITILKNVPMRSIMVQMLCTYLDLTYCSKNLTSSCGEFRETICIFENFTLFTILSFSSLKPLCDSSKAYLNSCRNTSHANNKQDCLAGKYLEILCYYLSLFICFFKAAQ